MAPQNDQEQPQERRALPKKLGTYSRRHKALLGRVEAQHGLTQNTQGDGVPMLDVCAFQSSV